MSPALRRKLEDLAIVARVPAALIEQTIRAAIADPAFDVNPRGTIARHCLRTKLAHKIQATNDAVQYLTALAGDN